MIHLMRQVGADSKRKWVAACGAVAVTPLRATPAEAGMSVWNSEVTCERCRNPER